MSDLSRTLSGPSAIEIKINPEQAKLINSLQSTGLYGNTPAQVVLRMLDWALIQLCHKGDPFK